MGPKARLTFLQDGRRNEVDEIRQTALPLQVKVSVDRQERADLDFEDGVDHPVTDRRERQKLQRRRRLTRRHREVDYGRVLTNLQLARTVR